MYYVRQEARQVALRFAARLSGLAFRPDPRRQVRWADRFPATRIITGDRFRVREWYRPFLLSYPGSELRYMVR